VARNSPEAQASAGAGAPALSRAQILGMAAMAIAVFVIGNDFTALSVALPAIEKDLAADVTTMQWVITGYALVFGVLLVTAGRLADMFGRRRIFFAGSATFAGFSVIGGLATDAWMLLAARALMGVGGAMMWPAILGMAFSLVPSGRESLAGALVLSAAGFSNAVGPLLGGALTDYASWRWIFFLNFPVTLVAALVTWRVVPRVEVNAGRERIDYNGILTLSIGLLALMLVLDFGADLGWFNPLILGLFLLAIVGLLVFWRAERRVGDNALVPRHVLANRTFFAASIATLAMSAIFFAALLYLPQFFTKHLGYSAAGAGAGLLPMMGVFALTSFVSGSLYTRLGAKLILSIGALCLTGGMYLLSWINVAPTYVAMIPGMVVTGIGIGLFYSSITTVGITALDPSMSSLAGAIIYMCQIAGGAVGLGLNTAIVVSASTLVEGIHFAFLVNTGLALIGLAVTVLFIGGRIDKASLDKLVHRHRAHG
jgi:EmrB/QacA subfamily drug resistance transporter